MKQADVKVWIDACGQVQAPASVVGSLFLVDAAGEEVLLAEAPVKEEVFGEEGGDQHAQAVVHVGCGLE
jgi:hypothetical protein